VLKLPQESTKLCEFYQSESSKRIEISHATPRVLKNDSLKTKFKKMQES
jgi:hypothetical protein